MALLLDFKHLDFPMRRVYSLAQELEDSPERISNAQALTLDESRPLIGLKGTYGLFGSKEWWASIENKELPLEFVAGKIKRAYAAGQDHSPLNNTIDLICSDNTEISVGIYTNESSDIDLFREGHWVELVYALDERKKQPARDGSLNIARLALEMAVSEEVV